MNVLDLFSGIGGFSLGLERAGMRTVAFCEIEPFCQAVLRKHWPNIPIYDDVRTLTAKRLAEDGIGTVDVICGGFPCQDISVAGKGAGITGSRSGLWTEYARLIGEIRPQYVIVENVAALLVRGMERVLGDLSEIGYDAEWHVISASDVGAQHLRKRVWIVAYPNDDTGARFGQYGREILPIEESIRSSSGGMADADSSRALVQGRNGDSEDQEWHIAPEIQERENIEFGAVATSGVNSVADSCIKQRDRWREWSCGWGREPQETLRDARRGGRQETWMSIPESELGRVAYGIPNTLHRLRGLGNAVVPQIPEIIGRAILQAEGLA